MVPLGASTGVESFLSWKCRGKESQSRQRCGDQIGESLQSEPEVEGLFYEIEVSARRTRYMLSQ